MANPPPRKAPDGLVRLATVAAALAVAVLAGAGERMPDGRPTPSGQPVPRWLTLKSDEVHARQGPGLDYRILWDYRVAGLPVQVIAETTEWRKICDPDGAVAWVHRSVVSSRRSLFNPQPREAAIRAGRSPDAAIRARLSPRSLVPVEACVEGWCEVRFRRTRGWIAAASLFGAAERPLCDANRPAGPRRTD